MASIHEIIVPTDFGPSSQAATELAVELAQKFDASLTLVHVWDAPAYAYSGMAANGDPVEVYQARAGLRLAGALDAVREVLPGARSMLVWCGDAEAGIRDAVGELRPDLVVMGTRARVGIMHAVLGSVAERVVRTLPVPVLTVHAPAASAATSLALGEETI